MTPAPAAPEDSHGSRERGAEKPESHGSGFRNVRQVIGHVGEPGAEEETAAVASVKQALLRSWVRGASLARHMVIVLRVTPSACWGPPRVVLLRATLSTGAAAHWQKPTSFADMRGSSLRCVGWGRYELRTNQTGDLVAVFRSEAPGAGCLALTGASLERLREIERHCWGPWRRSKIPALGYVCEVRWGPVPECPQEVLSEASRIASTKAKEMFEVVSRRTSRAGSNMSNASDTSEVSTASGGSSSSSSSNSSSASCSHCDPGRLCDINFGDGRRNESMVSHADGNLRLFRPTEINGDPVDPCSLRPSAHQISGLVCVRPSPGMVCAVCLGEAPESPPESVNLSDALFPIPLCLETQAYRSSRRPAWHKLPCGHVFHRSCILPWIRSGHACPLGRCAVPAAARVGRREMAFGAPHPPPMKGYAWRQLREGVMSRDIPTPQQLTTWAARLALAPVWRSRVAGSSGKSPPELLQALWFHWPEQLAHLLRPDSPLRPPPPHLRSGSRLTPMGAFFQQLIEENPWSEKSSSSCSWLV
mmetsp:Transcript_6007/g.11286  ORF Transcript_6007/g.11286 Transcript_6007/m.11286 type:complete len:533 (-) Transcript_6007:605-2203(-)